MEKEQQFADALGEFALNKAHELGLDAGEMLVNASRSLVILGQSLTKDGVPFAVSLDGIREMIVEAIDMVLEVAGQSRLYKSGTTQAAISTRIGNQIAVDVWDNTGKKEIHIITDAANDDDAVLKAMDIFENE